MTTKKLLSFGAAYYAFVWLIIESVDVLSASFGAPSWVMKLLWLVAGAAFPAALILRHIVLIRTRQRYIDRQLAACGTAVERLLFSFHSLRPAAANPEIGQLQRKISEAKRRGVDVRIVAPGGIDRLAGAFELVLRHKVSLRILPALEDQDFRFTLIDRRQLIVSQQPLGRTGLSREFVIIESERLNRVVHAYFDSLWNSPEAYELGPYVRLLYSEMNNSISRTRFAERAAVTPAELDTLLDKHDQVRKASNGTIE